MKRGESCVFRDPAHHSSAYLLVGGVYKWPPVKGFGMLRSEGVDERCARGRRASSPVVRTCCVWLWNRAHLGSRRFVSCSSWPKLVLASSSRGERGAGGQTAAAVSKKKARRPPSTHFFLPSTHFLRFRYPVFFEADSARIRPNSSHVLRPGLCRA